MANAGQISYEVEIDTANLLTAGRQVDKSLDEMETGFKKTDKAAAGLGDSLSAAAKSAGVYIDASGRMREANGRFVTSARKAELGITDIGGAAGSVISKLTPLAAAVAGVITVQTLVQWGKMAEQFTLLQARIKRLTPDLETASRTYQMLLDTASSTGQSMPETVKLWETLTTSLKSLGATNDQVVVLTATLQKIGKIGGSSAEETSNALRQLGQALASGTLRAEEFNSIAEQTPELIRQLAAAADVSMGDFRQAMLNGKVTAEELFDLLQKRVVDVDAEFRKLPRSAADAGNAVSIAFGAAVSKLDQALGASQKLARALDELAHGIARVSGSASEMDNLNAKFRDLAGLQRQLATQEDSWLPNPRMITDLQNRIRATKDEIAQMQAAMAPTKTIEGPKSGPTNTADGEKVIQQLAEQNALLRSQGEERARIQALQKIGTNATQAEKDLAVALAVDSYRLAEAEKARTKAKTDGANAAKKVETEAAQLAKKSAAEQKQAYEQNQKAVTDLATALSLAGLSGRELAQAQASLKLNPFATPEEVARVKALTDAMYDLNAAQNAKALGGQVDPFVGAQQELDTKLANIKTVEEAQVISTQRANELRLQSETAYNEQVKALEEERFRSASLGNEILLGGIDALGQAATQSLSGILSGTMNLQDALRGVANTILNSVIGAIVQIGVDWVKQQVIMAAAGQATAAATTAAAVGQAGITAAAWAPAAAMASLATLGTNAVAAASALTSTTTLASGLALVGGRALGGPVQSNGMYRVNETGAPEIFNAANGRQYMMPNQRGEVVSNKDATSGGGGAGAAPIINNHNYSGQPMQTTAKFSEEDKRWVIDTIVGDMASGGRSGQMANQITGTKRRGS